MDQVPEDVLKDVFGFEAPSESQLSAISVWAQRALELKANIDQIEAHLKMLNKELAVIVEVDLPQAILKAGMQEFKMKDGGKITVEDVIQGGISKDPEKRDKTLDWVLKEGGQEIIKEQFEISYPRGQYEDAVALRRLLQEKKVPFDEFESIHAQTLKAFLREKIKEGTIPPFEDFGIRYYKEAKIKPAKGK